MLPLFTDYKTQTAQAMNLKKILARIDRLESIGIACVQEATFLKQELSGVVSGNSPKRGLSLDHKAEVLSKRAQKRVQ